MTKLLLIALAFAAVLTGCKTRPENDRSKAYYIEGEHDRHNNRAGHMLHYK